MVVATSESRWEIYLAAAAEDAGPAKSLCAELRRGAQVFWEGAEVGPGEDRPAVSARALSAANIGVFVLSRATAVSQCERSHLASAIDHYRTDPLRRIIPVYLDTEAEHDPVYGVRTLQGLSLANDGAEVVAKKILEVVSRFRAQTKVRPRIAVVAVSQELSAEQHAVVQRLAASAARPEVESIDVADSGAREKASQADWRLLLLGARTGGSPVLKQLADQGAARLKAKVDVDDAPAHEVAAIQAIRAGVRVSFAGSDEAAHKAQEIFADWFKDWAPPDEGHSPALVPWEAKYLRARLDKWAKGSYGGLQARAGRRQLERSRLYVSLRAVADPTCYADEREELVVQPREAVSARVASSENEREKQRNPYLERVLSHRELPHLAIEGEAGSGKTVLLQHAAYALACRHLNEAAPASQLDEASLSSGAPLLPIPILLEARHLAELLPEGELGELTEALAKVLRKAADDPSIATDDVRAGLCAGRYLLLVDSLDEVPSGAARRRVLDCLDAFAQRADCRSRVVLTSRPTAHTGVSLAESRLRLIRIAPLEKEQVAQMADRWAETVGESAEYVELLREALGGLEERHPPGAEERSIPQNPQLLMCAFLVFDQQRLLPDEPAALFEEMVQILCKAKPAPNLTAEEKRRLLERAFEHIQRAGGTECDARQVAEALLGVQMGVATIEGPLELLDQLASETGLLRFEERRGKKGEEQRVARPWHRSFEEYLCACRLAAAPGSVADETDKLIGMAEAPGNLFNESWEGVLTFLFGVYVRGGRERAEAYVRQLLRRGKESPGRVPPRRRGRILGLAARCLAENPRVEIATTLRDELRFEIAERFKDEGASWPLRDRMLALEALGRLGDPRLDADRWVEIQGGTFTIGGDPKAFESPREVTIAPFRMMWRPITVQDFKAFVEGGGYANDDLWEADRPSEGNNEPDEWRRQLFHPNRPVTGVDWFEAMAFCRWASRQWVLEIDLPTEAEWEIAARGSEGAAYPWGNEEPGKGDGARANYRALESFYATPVGAFPSGNRGSLVDLAGNVWEWCRDEWAELQPKRKQAASSARGAPRVVRGGSWRSKPRCLRCAFRSGLHPEYRDWALGFRVVCRAFRQH